MISTAAYIHLFYIFIYDLIYTDMEHCFLKDVNILLSENQVLVEEIIFLSKRYTKPIQTVIVYPGHCHPEIAS